MEAIVQTAYGDAAALTVTRIAKPVPDADGVLVRVHAASLHAGDVVLLRGNPYPARFLVGWPKPRRNFVPGLSLAGVVESVGANVTSLKPGDEVFGEGKGACAQYALGTEQTLVAKPARLTFAQAAALPTSALTAQHALRDAAKVTPGQRVLVNGASGGVGLYGVQIAKALGASVTGVCSSANVDMVRRLGADRVIDYTKEDFTTGTDTYDLILDTVGNHSFSGIRRALAPTGLVLPMGKVSVASILAGLVRSLFTAQKDIRFVSTTNRDDLHSLAELVDAGKLTPAIDRTYLLHETPDAITYVASRHTRGKVVIVVKPDAQGA
ncbi:MAG: NAD(P)-dependent alcohol dehydrogenase [Propionibacteriaceae bacterium]|nr:NAD(P)-dependent alcohol dehydrogenase [Propionibacteriaceae bacterium]